MIFSESDFYAYCLYVQYERGYKKQWPDAMFKSYFNKWATKEVRTQVKKEPPKAFYDWLYSYFESAVQKGDL